MKSQGLGRLYKDGECILYEGDPADFLFVVQEGSVELAYDEPERTTRLVMLETGDVFGESALFSRAPRTTHARAVGSARVLTLDRQVLLRRLRQDPLLALELLRSMSGRVQALERVVKELRAQTPAGSNGSGRRS